MTYMQFHLVFIFPPLLAVAWWTRRLWAAQGRMMALALGFLTFMAVTYTTPWDNYLVAKQVWYYGADRVIGTIGYVPIEEYMFFVLQTWLTGLFVFALPNKAASSESKFAARWGVGACLAISLTGVAALFFESTFYYGLIAAWAFPVAALQWALGGSELWRQRRRCLLAILIPTVYLWVADGLAINFGIWEISERYTTGLLLLTLPVEEALFFFVTNVMVVQGIVLFQAYYEKSWQGLRFLSWRADLR